MKTKNILFVISAFLMLLTGCYYQQPAPHESNDDPHNLNEEWYENSKYVIIDFYHSYRHSDSIISISNNTITFIEKVKDYNNTIYRKVIINGDFMVIENHTK